MTSHTRSVCLSGWAIICLRDKVKLSQETSKWMKWMNHRIVMTENIKIKSYSFRSQPCFSACSCWKCFGLVQFFCAYPVSEIQRGSQEENDGVRALCGNRVEQEPMMTSSPLLPRDKRRHFCWTTWGLFLDLKTADSKYGSAQRASQSVLVLSFFFFLSHRLLQWSCCCMM